MVFLFALTLISWQIQFQSTIANCLGDCQPNHMTYSREECRRSIAYSSFLGPTLEITHQPTEERCAFRCYQNVQCQHAVYRSHRLYACILISELKRANTGTLYHNLWDYCILLKLHKPLRCRNCGEPVSFSCSCPRDYIWRHCEETKPAQCYGNWVDITGNQTAQSLLHQTEEVMKMLVPVSASPPIHQDMMSVYTLSSFEVVDNTFQSLANGHLSVDLYSETFETPATFEFKYFLSSSRVRTYTVALDGTPVSTNMNAGLSMTLFTKAGFEGIPVIYASDSSNYTDNPYVFAVRLSEGYRLLSRTPSRVGFIKVQSEAFFQSLTDSMGTSGTTLSTPLHFTSFKQTMRSGKAHIAEYFVGDGTANYLGSINATKRWQLDYCWYPLDPQFSLTNTFQIVREAVLRGQEVRVVMDNSVSSDVVEVTVTQQDVAVTLTPFLTPFNANGNFSENTTMVYSAISVRKTSSDCEVGFHGGAFVSLNTAPYKGKVMWVLGPQNWILAFQITSNLTIRDGSKENVTRVIKQGHDVRVCVEYSQGWTTCYRTAVAHVVGGSHAMIQTPPTVEMVFNTTTNKFKRIANADCAVSEHLISTRGWIKSMQYKMGSVSDTSLNESVAFNILSWFIVV